MFGTDAGRCDSTNARGERCQKSLGHGGAHKYPRKKPAYDKNGNRWPVRVP